MHARLHSLPAACALALLASLATTARAQVAGVDLAVTQAILVAPAAGGTTSVRVTVSNLGSVTLTNFQIVGGVVNASLSSVAGPLAACAKGRNSVYTCNVPSLAPGNSTDVIVTARVDNTAVSFVSNAQSSTTGDLNPANSRSQVSAPVLAAAPDVQLSGSASTSSPRVGTPYDYRFSVKVGGSAAAAGVSFTTVLPPEVVLLNASTSLGATCTQDGASLSCALGNMAAGTGADITLTVMPPATVGSSYAVSGVALAGDGRDANPGNNARTIDVTTR